MSLLLLQGAGSAGLYVWTPPAFPAVTTLFRFEADSNAAVGDGNPITSWADGGAGLPLTSTLTARPTYQAKGWDGIRPCVRFDGVNDKMSITSASSPPLEYFVVCRYNAVFSSEDVVLDGQGAYNQLSRTSATQMQCYANRVLTLTAQTPQSVHLYTMKVKNGSSGCSMAADGGTAVTDSGSNASTANGIYVGSAHTSSGFANVDVAAVFVTSNISAPDESTLVSYIRTKWATP